MRSGGWGARERAGSGGDRAAVGGDGAAEDGVEVLGRGDGEAGGGRDGHGAEGGVVQTGGQAGETGASDTQALAGGESGLHRIRRADVAGGTRGVEADHRRRTALDAHHHLAPAAVLHRRDLAVDDGSRRRAGSDLDVVARLDGSAGHLADRGLVVDGLGLAVVLVHRRFRSSRRRGRRRRGRSDEGHGGHHNEAAAAPDQRLLHASSPLQHSGERKSTFEESYYIP